MILYTSSAQLIKLFQNLQVLILHVFRTINQEFYDSIVTQTSITGKRS